MSLLQEKPKKRPRKSRKGKLEESFPGYLQVGISALSHPFKSVHFFFNTDRVLTRVIDRVLTRVFTSCVTLPDFMPYRPVCCKK